MTKNEFLSFSLPYGLMFKNLNDNTIEQLSGIDTYLVANWTVPSYPNGTTCVYSSVDYSSIWSINEIKLILHPLSDLTKPISQANYNNGEPFIPALELVKLEEKHNKWKDIAPTIPYDVAIINKPFGKVLKVSKLGSWVLILSLNEIERAKYYIVSQLIKWHFDIADLISKSEAIDVNTLDINPYK